MRSHLLIFAAPLLLAAACAQAGTITGQVWLVPEVIAQNAIPANVPGSPADATFSVPNGPINFTSFAGYTVGQFLSSGGASCTGADCSNLMDAGGFGTLIELVGTVSVTHGQSFTVTHDDGLTLIIGGMDLGFSPGPTSPNVSTVTWNGPTGNLPFTLVYGECCGAPAVLQTSLPLSSGVPEPASLGLMVAGGLGLLGLSRLRSKR